MVNVYIISNYPISVIGCREVLTLDASIDVVGEASFGEEVEQCVGLSEADVVLFDYSSIGARGFDMLVRINSLYPQLKYVAIGVDKRGVYSIQSLGMGVVGYLSKDSTSWMYCRAIQKAYNDEVYVCEVLASGLVSLITDKYLRRYELYDSLTKREKQVFFMLSQGQRCVDVSNELEISNKTVDTHRRNILGKLKLKNNADMARYAIKSGLHSLDYDYDCDTELP